MTKLDLKTVAQSLAVAHNINEADAEKFLKVVFEVVIDGLRHDSQVKIKGLGTFKLIGVPEREMIDVNSGERITVEARNRISFSPDAILRDIINKPFVFFDTVILNDGVVFDDETETETTEEDEEQDMEENHPTDLEQDEESQEESSIETNTIETVVEESQEDVEESIEDKTNETLSSNDVEENVQSVEQNNTETKEEITESTSEDVVKETPVEEPITSESQELPNEDSETKQNDTPKAVNDALNDARSVMDDIQSGKLETEDEEDEEEERGFFSRHFWTIFISLVALVGVSAFVYGLYGNEIMALLGYNDNEEEPIEVVETKPSTPIAVADTLNTDSIKNDTISKDTVKVPTLPVDSVKKDTIDSSYYDSLDVRVRTGAYKIVGVDTIVKVQQGQTFRSITKAYLGEGMECYIEVFNGVKSVKPGDTLKIPKLKWKKKRRK